MMDGGDSLVDLPNPDWYSLALSSQRCHAWSTHLPTARTCPPTRLSTRYSAHGPTPPHLPLHRYARPYYCCLPRFTPLCHLCNPAASCTAFPYTPPPRSPHTPPQAYSLHDLEVAYCQGMAFMAGVLLMYVPEEMAFRCGGRRREGGRQGGREGGRVQGCMTTQAGRGVFVWMPVWHSGWLRYVAFVAWAH